MKPGKAFEIFVKRLLMCVGFSEVMSDGLYIYDASPGQMIQGKYMKRREDPRTTP